MVGALVVAAIAISGCGDDDAPAGAESDAVSTSTIAVKSAFVVEVNALCAAMIPQILEINADEQEPVAATFIEKTRQKEDVYEVFDAEVAALPVAPADERAAEAFDAFVARADADTAALAKVAATGDAAAFDSRSDELFEAFRNSPVTAELEAVGIDCPAR